MNESSCSVLRNPQNRQAEITGLLSGEEQYDSIVWRNGTNNILKTRTKVFKYEASG